MKRLPFITGSQAYGTPTCDSDIDMVVYMSKEDACQLLELYAEVNVGVQLSAGDVKAIDTCTTASLLFGKLNLIVVTKPEHYDCWKDGTEFLKTKRPVSKAKAKKYFTKKRKRLFGTEYPL